MRVQPRVVALIGWSGRSARLDLLDTHDGGPRSSRSRRLDLNLQSTGRVDPHHKAGIGFPESWFGCVGMQDDLHASLMPFGRDDYHVRRREGVIGALVIYEKQSAVKLPHFLLLGVVDRPPEQFHL